MGFSFKKFSVSDSSSAMKVGTDGVLLGAWMNVPVSGRVLDIGAGSGLIALMAAQRTEGSGVEVDAVEIDSGACVDAEANFDASPWSGRLHLHNCPVQQFRTDSRYSLIVSNPPYYDNSLKNPDAQRSTARHTDMLPTVELLDIARSLLAPDGAFAVVLPFEASAHFLFEARCRGFHLERRCDVRTTSKRAVRRTLLEMRLKPAETVSEVLTIQQGSEFTDEYRALTKDFYLKF